ncbi:hypothetical protein [Rodentibacter caecimuris]|uniref:hypothetical protein n=1 Tax=Rodentibacter caecimuris TaxID=1796644 RepID=UPI0025864AE6|nr:hypothetical protein [Rodentibacter heylii]
MKATITVIEIEERQDSLSDSDKERIKEAVLHRARNNPNLEIVTFVRELREAFILINA